LIVLGALLGAVLVILGPRLVRAIRNASSIGAVMEAALEGPLERIAPTISREEAAALIGVRVPDSGPPPGGDVRFKRGEAFVHTFHPLSAQPSDAELLRVREEARDAFLPKRIRDCTRPQPHDGPCNGWPCAPRRNAMRYDELAALRAQGHPVDDLPTMEYAAPVSDLAGKRAPWPCCRCGVPVVGKGTKCDRCLLQDAGA